VVLFYPVPRFTSVRSGLWVKHGASAAENSAAQCLWKLLKWLTITACKNASAVENLASLHVRKLPKVAEKLRKITACQKLLLWMTILSNKLRNWGVRAHWGNSWKSLFCRQHCNTWSWRYYGYKTTENGTIIVGGYKTTENGTIVGFNINYHKTKAMFICY